jgi:hypothetical protein
VAVVGFRNEYGIDWLTIGAAAVQRYLVRGLTMGSVNR